MENAHGISDQHRTHSRKREVQNLQMVIGAVRPAFSKVVRDCIPLSEDVAESDIPIPVEKIPNLSNDRSMLMVSDLFLSYKMDCMS
ncbi:magnesium and cobalt transport protein CorA [Sesbania bispinosa]|nr:magnesium and cobalt transport protein CorA [Sesbania bispinosa]